MKHKLALVICGLAMFGAVTVGSASAQAQARAVTSPPITPGSTCIAAETGAKGNTGPTGATGATGPQGGWSQGPIRGAHQRAYPYCAELPGVCAYGLDGPDGLTGATGATGPMGDTVPFGVLRSIHIRQIDPCAGFPAPCRYNVSPRGDTGLMGATGQQGPPAAPTGAPDGPSRVAHRVVAGENYQPGDVVPLTGCALPNTGSGPTTLLPWSLALLGLGSLGWLVTRRRRVTA